MAPESKAAWAYPLGPATGGGCSGKVRRQDGLLVTKARQCQGSGPPCRPPPSSALARMEKIISRIRDLPACTYCTTLPEAQFSTTFGQQLSGAGDTGRVGQGWLWRQVSSPPPRLVMRLLQTGVALPAGPVEPSPRHPCWESWEKGRSPMSKRGCCPENPSPEKQSSLATSAQDFFLF